MNDALPRLRVKRMALHRGGSANHDRLLFNINVAMKLADKRCKSFLIVAIATTSREPPIALCRSSRVRIALRSRGTLATRWTFRRATEVLERSRENH